MRLKFLFNSMLCLLFVLGASTVQFAQISITSAGFSYSQDFNTLASSGTSSTVPTGWAFSESGTNANTTYTAGTGSGNAGDTYSFGLSGNSERAFGGLFSNSLTPTIGGSFTNNTGGVIESFDISYTGETWRIGGINRSDMLLFEYSTNATSLTTGTWTAFPALNYSNNAVTVLPSPQGGTMLQSANISATIGSLSLANGSTIWIRWNDLNASGSDDGLAVDDFSLSNVVLEGPCTSIATLTCDVPATASLSGAGVWNTTACGFSTPGQEKIYSFTPTNTGLHNLQVNSGTGDFIDYFYKLASDGCSSTGWSCIADIGGSGATTFGPLTAGVEYYILLDAETTTASTQNLQINCAVILAPDNDLCSGAITLSPIDNEYCGTTIGAGADLPNGGVTCGTNADAEGSGVWYTFEGNGQDWEFFFPQQGEDWDPEVNVYSGSCGNYTCVTGDDDGGGGLSAQFTVNSVSGTTYYVYVHPACGEVGCGTSDFCFNVTLTGAAPVVLTCPTNQTESACLSQDTINAHFNTWLATASGTGGCNGVLTNNNIGAPSACGGSTTVTFTYTSTCAPTTTTCQATFTVPAPPTVVLTCPTNTTVAACQTQSSINEAFGAWLATASASGGCNGVLTNNNTGAPSACGGSTTVTFTYTSTCAPTTTTCQATFTVSAPPTVVLTCPTNTTVAACQTQGAVDAQFAAWLATASASGGCNGVLTNNNTGAPSSGGGSTTVTFTYTSSCAPTTTTCQATFTVTAAPPVVLTCPTNTTVAACQTQAAVNSAFATWLATASASGGCNGVLTNNNIGAPAACGGSTTVTFTYTSTTAPTTTTCQATFTVAAAPTVVLTCPTNTTVAACQTQAAVNTAFAAWLATASASGGCNGVLTNNNIGAPAACGGSTTVTFTYTSSCAPTTTTCQATFTVSASTPVVLNCPVPTTASACLTQAQLNTAYSTWLASATTSGGCGGTITNNAPAAPLICNANAQTVTVTFSVTNTCTGVATTCTSTFTVPAYPDFTVPANGASQVNCPSQIVQPTPPTVLDACSKTLTPTGPVIVNNPNPITCEGTRTYTWTYTDCAGHSHTWSHVVTVERQPFTVPANGGTTVACPDQTDVQPVPPVITSNCGETLTPVVTSTSKPFCEGTRTWNFAYTDCEGNTATWSFVYTVEYQDFIVPASETVTTECTAGASVPVPPVVFDNCGKQVVPTGPVITKTINAFGCEGSRKYEYTYKDCEGNTHVWSKTFNFSYTEDFFVYPDGETPVACLNYAQFPPVPPTVYGACGEVVSVSGPVVIEENVDPSGCSGTRKFVFTYTDCGGHSHPWSFTYHAVDNEPPVGNCASGLVDETNLGCIDAIPCPEDYDFSGKIQELLDAGGYYDLCSGDDLVVKLDSWSELEACNDDDGDGTYTFGRTFYFSIADQCGNQVPDLCSVTYSGTCLPLETFPQEEWGNAGGEPANTVPGNLTDLQLISTLLGQGPLVVGGTNRSLTLTDAQCLVNLVPGVGNPSVLGNCHQTNCAGGCNPAGPIGMKNTLATNAIALTLNIRYNIEYNGLNFNAIRAQSLDCVTLDPNIVHCDENGSCKLRVFESNGTVHEFPYTIGGLLDMANYFLDGGWGFTDGAYYTYGAGLNKSISNVNAYWHGGGLAGSSCNPAAGVSSPVVVDKPLPGLGQPKADKVAFNLAPNPASSEVSFKLTGLAESQDVVFEVYNPLGQLVLSRSFRSVASINERINIGSLGSGLYLVSVKAGNERYEQKLLVAKN